MSFTQKILIPLSDQVDTSFIEHQDIFEGEGDSIALIGSVIDKLPLMLSDSTPSPYVTSASSSEAAQLPFRSCDNDFTDFASSWLATIGQVVGWWKIDVGIANAFNSNKYTITALNLGGTADRAPKDWTFEGSNTGAFAGEETILDTQSGITGWSAGETKQFSFSNATSFRYYRWDITANNGSGSFLQVQEFEIFKVFATTSPSPAAVWTAIPSVGAVVDMSTAKCWMFKDGVIQAAGNTHVKFKYAANNGALSSSLTLAALRLESDPTIADAVNSFKAVGVYASDGTYESKSSAWFEIDVIYPENGGGGGLSTINGGIINV